MGTIWHFIRFESETKAHVVPAGLRDGIMDDIVRRGAVVAEERVILTAGIDHGGMVFKGRPWVDAELDGLKFSVACDAIREFTAQLLGLPLRKLADGTPYYKLHGHWTCVVLSPEQREQLIVAWTEALPDAETRAESFFDAVEEKLAASSRPVVAG